MFMGVVCSYQENLVDWIEQEGFQWRPGKASAVIPRIGGALLVIKLHPGDQV